MLKSRTWVRPFSRLLPWTNDVEKEMQVQLARIWVLYTDLQLETDVIAAEPMPVLDRTSTQSRHFYFMRKTTVTLAEFRSAFIRLNMNDEFRSRVGSMSFYNRTLWEAAIKFFQDYPPIINTLRNDFGGHFLESAARDVVEKIDRNSTDILEVYSHGQSSDLRLKFTTEIVAWTVFRHLEKGGDKEVFARKVFEAILEASRHSINAAQAVASVTLFA